jgi:hypothetical protein
MSADASSVFWEITAARADEFVAKGHRRRHFFPHRTYHLPKCGPDGLQLAELMLDRADPAAIWELVLYADAAGTSEFPVDLFFDDEVVWHRQQFGRPGQVATATIILDGKTVSAITYLSDLVQRISRRREHKTRIEKRFEGWRQMLLNGVLAFARAHGAEQIRTPSAALARRHTDVARLPQLGLFERIYDRTVTEFLPARRDGDWWIVDRGDFSDRVVMPERRAEAYPRRKTICICHDLERSRGRALEEMRRIEAELGVRATYFVFGSQMSEVRTELEADGHAVAFHSFDDRPDREDQLHRCREVDYRIKGYRPRKSKFTVELSDRDLLWHNFEWVAGAPRAIDSQSPQMRTGLVRLPIACDDYPPDGRVLSWDEWERRALSRIAEAEFTAVSLPDRYGPCWLPRYRRFLDQAEELGELRTLEDVAAEVTLSSAA